MSVKNSPKHLVKFLIVGAVGTIVHYAILFLLVRGMAISPATAAMVGASAGAFINYVLNRTYSFASNRAHREALPRFFGLVVVGIIFNGVIVKGLTLLFVNYMVAQVIATVFILGLNFFVSGKWIFK